VAEPVTTQRPTTTTTERPTTTTTERAPIGPSSDRVIGAWGVVVRNMTDSFEYLSDQSLYEVAQSICAGLGGGRTFEEAVTLGVQTLDATPEDMASIVGGAVSTFCPEQMDEVTP
jgi:hypothetical protein